MFTAQLQVKPLPGSWFVSPFVLHSLMAGFKSCVDAFLGLMTAMEGCCCRYGEALGLRASMMWCCFFMASFCGLLAIKAQAASVQVLNVEIKHAVAASAVAIRNRDPNSLQVASDASGCEYHCCDRDPHAAAAAAAAMSGESLCIPLIRGHVPV